MFHWFRSRRQPLPVRPASQRHRRRPTLEVLEGRLTPSTLTVSNLNDSGPASLRQAILDSNADPARNGILFAIPGAGVHTISPTSPRPDVTDPVTIDGYSQPGASPNTLMVGESVGRAFNNPANMIPWIGAGYLPTAYGMPADFQMYHFSSYHSGLVQFVMADGSVRGLRSGFGPSGPERDVFLAMSGYRDGTVYDPTFLGN